MPSCSIKLYFITSTFGFGGCRCFVWLLESFNWKSLGQYGSQQSSEILLAWVRLFEWCPRAIIRPYFPDGNIFAEIMYIDCLEMVVWLLSGCNPLPIIKQTDVNPFRVSSLVSPSPSPSQQFLLTFTPVLVGWGGAGSGFALDNRFFSAFN